MQLVKYFSLDCCVRDAVLLVTRCYTVNRLGNRCRIRNDCSLQRVFTALLAKHRCADDPSSFAIEANFNQFIKFSEMVVSNKQGTTDEISRLL